MRTFTVNGKAHARHSNTTLDHRNLVTGFLHNANKGQPRITGPIEVELTFCFERPASHYGTGKNADRIKGSSPRFHTKAPDVDKLVRLVLDAMENAGIVANDSQVVQVTAQKEWAVDMPGTIVNWREL